MMNCNTLLSRIAVVTSLLVAAGCTERASTPPQAAPSASPPTSSAAPVADQWLGQWNGPEGTFLKLTGSNGRYEVTIQNLDGPRTFPATAAGERLEFERDGVRESVRASNGAETGMKWLGEKKDCLTVKVGEGYCRD